MMVDIALNYGKAAARSFGSPAGKKAVELIENAKRADEQIKNRLPQLEAMLQQNASWGTVWARSGHAGDPPRYWCEMVYFVDRTTRDIRAFVKGDTAPIVGIRGEIAGDENRSQPFQLNVAGLVVVDNAGLDAEIKHVDGPRR